MDKSKKQNSEFSLQQISELAHQSTQKDIILFKPDFSKLRLIDDLLMTLVFNHNTKAVSLILQIILGIDDLEVTQVRTQEEVSSPNPSGRKVVFDIFAKDCNDNYYDIEMQRSVKGMSPQRSRIHGSMLDAYTTNAGKDFKETHNSYVIFIVENDIYNKNLPIYHVTKKIKETDDDYDDGLHIIYVNANYENNELPIGKLIHDLKCTKTSDMNYEILANSINYFKGKEGAGNMDELLDEMINDDIRSKIENMVKEYVEEHSDYFEAIGEERGEARGEAKGEARGMEKEKRINAIKLIALDKLSLEEIATVVDLPLSTTKELADGGAF